MQGEGIVNSILALVATATSCLNIHHSETVCSVAGEYQYVGATPLPVESQPADHVLMRLPCIDRENRPGIE